MTAPMSILSSLVQPVAKAAIGDVVGAGLSGFDALLGMLTQSLKEIGETQPGEPAANGDVGTDKPIEGHGADAVLAAWLARGGENPLLAQTLGQAAGQARAEPDPGETPQICAIPVGKTPVQGLDAVPTEAAPATGPGLDERVGWSRTPPPFPAGRDSDETTNALAAIAQLREGVARPAAPQAPTVQASAARGPAVVGDAPAPAQAAHNPLAQPPQAAPAEASALPEALVVAVAAEAQGETQRQAQSEARTQAAAPQTVQAVAAPVLAAPPLDPKTPGARKPGAPVSPTAELKSERQADRPAALDPAAKPSPAQAADAANEDLLAEAPPPETEAPPVQARTAERMESALQALTGRLESLAAGATAFAAQVRAVPETVTKLAAGIVDRLDGQASRFELQLDPLGLGKVDVRVEIAADGRLSAQLGFESAQGLAELRGRVQELRQALEQAGFSLGEDSLSFDFAGQNRGQDGQPHEEASSAAAGKAFARALGVNDEAADTPIRYQARRGLDLLV